jgi:hypothetical protein
MLGRGFALELVGRVIVEVGAARPVIEEEGLVALGHLLDELHRVVGPFLVELGADGDGDLLDVLDLAALLGVDEVAVEGEALDHLGALGARHDLREVVGIPPFGVHVRDAQEPVEVVEAHVLRLGTRVLPAVPLAHGLRHIARLAEELCDGDLAVEASLLPVHGGIEDAVPHGETTREDGGARGGAGGLGVGGGEDEALVAQFVHGGGGGAHGRPAAEDAEVAVTHVVHQKDQNVGLLAGLLLQRGELGLGLGFLALVEDDRFHVLRGPYGLLHHGVRLCLGEGRRGRGEQHQGCRAPHHEEKERSSAPLFRHRILLIPVRSS